MHNLNWIVTLSFSFWGQIWIGPKWTFEFGQFWIQIVNDSICRPLLPKLTIRLCGKLLTSSQFVEINNFINMYYFGMISKLLTMKTPKNNFFLPFQEGKEYGLSAVVEDYHTRFILPCRLNANSLFAMAQKVVT